MGPKKTNSGSKLTNKPGVSSKSKPTGGGASKTSTGVSKKPNATATTKTTGKTGGKFTTTGKVSSSKPPGKTSSKPKGPTKEDVAAIKIQKVVRGFLAQVELRKLKKKKEDYDKMIDDLQRQAWLDIIERQRKEDEIALQKEEELRRRQRQEKKWRKDLLDAAFDGELETIESILQEALDATRKNSSLAGESLDRVVWKVKMNLLHCEDANNLRK